MQGAPLGSDALEHIAVGARAKNYKSDKASK